MGGRWGYIDREGTKVIQPRFVFAGPFHNGRACVSEHANEKVAIDRSGKAILGAKCD